MIGTGPKQLARLGGFYLEEAILDVLLDARRRGVCLGAKGISVAVGLFRDEGGDKCGIAGMNDAIATGFLIKLHGEGRVERCSKSGSQKTRGWRITAAEASLRTEADDPRQTPFL